MKTVSFEYICNNQSGEYVKAEVAQALLNALKNLLDESYPQNRLRTGTYSEAYDTYGTFGEKQARAAIAKANE